MNIILEILLGLIGQRLIVWMLILLIFKVNIKALHPIVGILAVGQYGIYVEPTEFITVWTTIGFFLPELIKLTGMFKTEENNKRIKAKA